MIANMYVMSIDAVARVRDILVDVQITTSEKCKMLVKSLGSFFKPPGSHAPASLLSHRISTLSLTNLLAYLSRS